MKVDISLNDLRKNLHVIREEFPNIDEYYKGILFIHFFFLRFLFPFFSENRLGIVLL